jgi:hypothetical protein
LWAGLAADDFFFAALFRESTTPVVEYVVPALVQMKDVPTTFYRPVAFITLFAEARAWGGATGPMHAANLGLHAASALGLWWLATLVCRGVGRTGSAAFRSDPEGWHRTAALVAALQWAWFPRRVEPVAWLSCRPDLLATALATWSVAAWISGERRGSGAVRWTGVALWLGALASKESVALLPLALLALPTSTAMPGTVARSGRLRQRLVRLWPFAFALAIVGGLRRLALGTWVGGYGAGVLVPSASTPLKHLVYPFVPPLEFLDRWGGGGAVAVWVTLLLLVVAIAVGAAWFTVRTQQGARFGAAWVVAATVPVASLMPSLVSTMNDRLMYLPSMGFAIGLAVWLSARGRTARFLCLLAIVVLLAQTVSLSQAWKSAGERTQRLAAAVADVASRQPAGMPLLVAAAPDSYRGAYMLRNGLDFAVRGQLGPGSAPVIVFTNYLVGDLAAMPVEVTSDAVGGLRVSSRDPRPAVMPGTGPDLDRWAVTTLHGQTGSFGRWTEAQVALRRAGVVLVAAPDRVDLMGPMGPKSETP